MAKCFEQCWASLSEALLDARRAPRYDPVFVSWSIADVFIYIIGGIPACKCLNVLTPKCFHGVALINKPEDLNCNS